MTTLSIDDLMIQIQLHSTSVQMTLTTLFIDDLLMQVQDISESYGQFGQDAFLDTFLFKVRSSPIPHLFLACVDIQLS